MDEVLEMGQEDIKRHHVIRNVLERRTTQQEAGRILGLCERQIRRLCAKVRTWGARGVLHALKGRPSNHQADPEVLERALCALHSPRWEGFGPKFAQEKLGQLCGIGLSDETIRKLMSQVDLWHPRQPKARHRQWRERRHSVGMMTQLDGSEHDWFEGRGPKCALIIFIDDAKSEVLYGEFAPVEETLTLFRATQAYLQRRGRPESFYVDRDSIYKVNHFNPDCAVWRTDEPMTQFGRAMKELGIEVIFAYSPQAKGRVERGFATHQDRLVKELRLRGISNIADANRFLWETYIPEHNARFAVPAAKPGDFHRPLNGSQRLDQILAIHTERTVFNDFTVRHDNKFFQILKDQPLVIRPKQKIEIEDRLDGSMHMRFKGAYLSFKPIEKIAYKPYFKAYPSKLKDYKNPPRHPNYKPPRTHPWRTYAATKAGWKTDQTTLTAYGR